MNKTQKIMLAVNAAVITAVFVLNYFYQVNGFSFVLKCICTFYDSIHENILIKLYIIFS